MSLAGVHPVDLHARERNHSGCSSTRSHSVESLPATLSLEDMHNYINSEAVLTIEGLRLQLNSCFTCGVSWQDDHVSLDCRECGGYSLERPCPLCDGRCSTVWKRDLTMSHSSGRAQWDGQCAFRAAQCDARRLQSLVENEDLCKRLQKLDASS